MLQALGMGAVVLLAGCASSQRSSAPAIDPDEARARIMKALPPKVQNPVGWSVDMFAAFEALEVPPTAENICAVVGVTDQESNFQVDPPVAGLAGIARREIDAKAARLKVPKLLVSAALEITSPNGKSYRERLDRVKTEKDLSEIFQDFIRSVPLGERLFGDLNPVRTGGPMQVSIAFAEKYARENRYPYPVNGTIREEIFTRRGGMFFGMAHLLDYPASYDDMVYRFADFNAGHYASRNAAFQRAVTLATGTKLALDGDLLLRGENASQPSKTELAIRKVSAELRLDDAEIREALEQGEEERFEKTKLYERLFALADKKAGQRIGRARLPQIALSSPKITRKLTTEWFAKRVQTRYQGCMARLGRGPQSPGG
jgi:hypothetical protein